SSDVAVSLLTRALNEPPPPEQRAEIVRALGMAQRLLDNPEAIRLLSEAFALVPDAKRRARIGIELGRCLLRANQHEQAMDAFRSARDVLADADSDLADSSSSTSRSSATASAAISSARRSATGRRAGGETANARSSSRVRRSRRSGWTCSAPAACT